MRGENDGNRSFSRPPRRASHKLVGERHKLRLVSSKDCGVETSEESGEVRRMVERWNSSKYTEGDEHWGSSSFSSSEEALVNPSLTSSTFSRAPVRTEEKLEIWLWAIAPRWDLQPQSSYKIGIPGVGSWEIQFSRSSNKKITAWSNIAACPKLELRVCS